MQPILQNNPRSGETDYRDQRVRRVTRRSIRCDLATNSAKSEIVPGGSEQGFRWFQAGPKSLLLFSADHRHRWLYDSCTVRTFETFRRITIDDCIWCRTLRHRRRRPASPGSIPCFAVLFAWLGPHAAARFRKLTHPERSASQRAAATILPHLSRAASLSSAARALPHRVSSRFNKLMAEDIEQKSDTDEQQHDY